MTVAMVSTMGVSPSLTPFSALMPGASARFTPTQLIFVFLLGLGLRELHLAHGAVDLLLGVELDESKLQLG